MKNFRAFLLITAILSLGAIAQAQTMPTNSPNWFIQVEQWATSIDTNNVTTFVDSRFLAETGVESVQNGGAPIDNVIRLSYDVVHPSGSNVVSGFCFGPNLVERDSGVQGTFVGAGFGLDAGYVKNDLRVDLYLNGDYNTATPSINASMNGEAGFEIKKALGRNTFMFLGFDVQFPKVERIFAAGAGFTL